MPNLIKGSSILIVDDIAQNLEVLGNTLKNSDFHIAIAINGEQALRIAEAKLPDLILLDVTMPGINGYEVSRRLKANPATEKIPIIFITAKNRPEEIIEGFQAGCVDYITKPFNQQELLARVFTHLELKKSREDIELRKEVESKLREAKNNAEEISRLKSSIINNLSHEFRTPLISVIGFAQILSDSVEDQDYSDMAGNILQAGRRLLITLNSILALSELEAGKIKASGEVCDLNDAALQISYLLKADAEVKNLSFDILPSQDASLCLVDRTLFDQVLIYVLDNAIKYTETGGITLQVSTESDIHNNAWAKLTVSDTGIGIRESDQKKIFEEFRQVSEGYTREFEGTGLGLTIAKKMMHLMNGRISVKSTPGKGSVFTLLLPAP